MRNFNLESEIITVSANQVHLRLSKDHILNGSDSEITRKFVVPVSGRRDQELYKNLKHHKDTPYLGLYVYELVNDSTGELRGVRTNLLHGCSDDSDSNMYIGMEYVAEHECWYSDGHTHNIYELKDIIRHAYEITCKDVFEDLLDNVHHTF